MIYLINGAEADSNNARFDIELAAAYDARHRPICQCVEKGVEMYIAKIGDSHYIKRMPGTGHAHGFRCISFEPPSELSGLGDLMGSAIKEEQEKDLTLLRLGFSLSKGPGRAAPEIGESTGVPGEVKADTSKLSMRALLHYLFEQSGLTRFDESIGNKRNWYHVRKMLMMASESKATRSDMLSKLLYIPETFFLDKKDQITANRRKLISGTISSGKGRQNMMVIIGEVKDIAVNRYGGWIAKIKHMPDFNLKIADDLHKRIYKSYGFEMNAWENSPESCKLIIMGTFFAESSTYGRIESCTLMCVDENWIPFETMTEKYVMESLNELGRPYIKSLRYNLNSSTPFASFILTDTKGGPTAMYLESSDGNDPYRERLKLLLEKTKMKSWVWREDADTMPDLPE